tara:strand:- start:578 stop:1468 length:891 start_codon:yes stop_codon:yes gene_type:complete
MSEFIKPFIKWVGGKTQIIHQVTNTFPTHIHNYHEPFLGGGSVLLAILSLKKQGKLSITGNIYASDINIPLINTYISIQSNIKELITEIKKYLHIYNNCSGEVVNRNPQSIHEATSSKESYYYWLRNTFNNIDKNSIKSSALFIILNKLCFRGIYREGPNGFNVPYGHYKNPSVIDETHLYIISDLIKDVKFMVKPFQSSLQNINVDDFVYIDPPYAPETSKSFVKYNKEGFGLDQHKSLFNILTKSKFKFVMSNSNVQLVLDKFSNYSIQEIMCKRRVNSKKPQSTTTEVLIYNF